MTAAEADVEALADMEGEGRPDAEGESDNEIEDVSESGDVLDCVGCIVIEGLSLLVAVENPVLLALVDRLIVGVAVGLEDAVRLTVAHIVDDRVALRVREALPDAERSEEKVLHTVLDAVCRGDWDNTAVAVDDADNVVEVETHVLAVLEIDAREDRVTVCELNGDTEDRGLVDTETETLAVEDMETEGVGLLLPEALDVDVDLPECVPEPLGDNVGEALNDALAVFDVVNELVPELLEDAETLPVTLCEKDARAERDPRMLAETVTDVHEVADVDTVPEDDDDERGETEDDLDPEGDRESRGETEEVPDPEGDRERCADTDAETDVDTVRVELRDRVGEALVDVEALSDGVAETDLEFFGDTETVAEVDEHALDEVHPDTVEVEVGHSDVDGVTVCVVETVEVRLVDTLGVLEPQDVAV